MECLLCASYCCKVFKVDYFINLHFVRRQNYYYTYFTNDELEAQFEDELFKWSVLNCQFASIPTFHFISFQITFSLTLYRKEFMFL